MSEIQLSVLCAVYGLPKRMLREGLDCLLRQTVREVEFLLVNDCSPDDFTRDILEEYAAKDTRFRIIDNPVNLGLPRVRNLALENARGKYFTMIDPDDLVPDDYCAVMLGVAEYYSADMVTCAIRAFQDGEAVSPRSDGTLADFCKLPRPAAVRKMLRQKFVCRLFRMETVGDLRFEPALIRGSDLLFIHQYLLRCRVTIDIAYHGYYYRHGRIFAHGETAVPARPKQKTSLDQRDAVVIRGFFRLFADCRTEEEKEFVSYMTVRRFLRCYFGARKHPHAELVEIQRRYGELFREAVAPLLGRYGVLGQAIGRAFAAPAPAKAFFLRLQLLRLFFELAHLPYHCRKTRHKLALALRRVAC